MERRLHREDRAGGGTCPASGVNHFSLPAGPWVQAQVAAWIGLGSGTAAGEQVAAEVRGVA